MIYCDNISFFLFLYFNFNNVKDKLIIEFINDINTSSMSKRICGITENNQIQLHVNQPCDVILNVIQRII
mgnify:CR=1 FL=1